MTCPDTWHAASSRSPWPYSWPKSRGQVTTLRPFSTRRLRPSAPTGIDQVTLAGLIAYDRTTITGVIDRLVQKGLVARHESSRDRRARELKITDAGRRTLRGVTPAVEAAQRILLRGLTEKEAKELMRLLQKAIAAGNELSRAPLRDAATG